MRRGDAVILRNAGNTLAANDDLLRLKGRGALQVVYAFRTQEMRVDGESIALEMPPLNYRLLWVR